MTGSATPRFLGMPPVVRRLVLVVTGAVLLLTIVRPVGAPPEPAGATIVLRDPSNRLDWRFDACWALGSEHEVIEHKVVDDTGMETVVKLPGRLRFLDLECSRPISQDRSLWEWRALVEQGNLEEARRNLEFDLLDATFRGIDTWTVGTAWPSSLEAVLTPNASTERIRIVMETVVRRGEAPPPPTPRPTSPPTPVATNTPVSTLTPTPVVATPTPTPIPPVDPIFSDGFDSGDASKWSSKVGMQ